MASLLRKLASEPKHCIQCFYSNWRSASSRAPVPYAELLVGDPEYQRQNGNSISLAVSAIPVVLALHQSRTQQIGELPAGIPRETFRHEQRVAVTPASCIALLKAGFQGVVVESGAGAAAGFVVIPPAMQSIWQPLQQPPIVLNHFVSSKL